MARFGLIAHGGTCCGVTHLYLGGSHSPDNMMAPLEKFNFEKVQETGTPLFGYLPLNPGAAPGSFPTTQHVFVPGVMCAYSYPAQTQAERVDDQLAMYVHRVRTSGIIEVALTGGQKPAWDEFLLERGFKEVGSAVNSNTNREIHIYLLFYNKHNIAKVLKDAFARLEEEERKVEIARIEAIKAGNKKVAKARATPSPVSPL